MPTLHIVSYFAGTDAFMSLHKHLITLFQTPKSPFYELTNSFHANINLQVPNAGSDERTDGQGDFYKFHLYLFFSFLSSKHVQVLLYSQ